ncbi:MAG TPA: hypothetical protein VK599_17390 [Streptosporangiaceae bacterium]|jgi:hypothetical protein|nr:hypothetical protein [Streptosporangiaceae bacterium]
MADTAKPGSARDGRQQPGSEPEQAADAARHPTAAAPGTAPDRKVLSEDPPTGGLTAVLGKLRDAAAAHDDELSDPGSLPQPG